MASTADYLIYALGAGHGHARRGWLMQRALREHGATAMLLMRPGAGRHLPCTLGPCIEADSFLSPALEDLRRHPPPSIIVDTFPTGWRAELDEKTLGMFRRKVWLARHGKALPIQRPSYDRIVTPYPPGRCEWGGRLQGAQPAGYVIDSTHLAMESDHVTFALLDTESRCDTRLLSILERLARKAGLRFQPHRSLDRPITARKLLVVGAGYHSFYECVSKNLDVRFLPVHKRHDDQFARAARMRRDLTHLDQILPWLDAPVDNFAVDTRADWSALVRELQA